MNTSTLSNSAFQDEITKFVPNKRKVYRLPTQVQSGNRVRVAVPNFDWYEVLNPRFDELTALPVGWDGYLGRPVKFTLAYFAANLIEKLVNSDLPPPSLVPGGDGTLQIEWHRNYYDVEILVLAPFDVMATRFDQISGEVEEVAFDSDFTGLAEWIDALEIDEQRMALGGAVHR